MQLSIPRPPRALRPMAADDAAAAAGPALATLRYLDAFGAAIGEDMVPAAPAFESEIPPAPGGTGWAAVTPALRVDVMPPDGAVTIEVTEAGQPPFILPLAAAAAAPPTPPTARAWIGPAQPALAIGAMSEGFADEAAFHARCAELRDHLISLEPFRRFADHIAVRALFWPPLPAPGRLDVEAHTADGRHLFGDQSAAAACFDRAQEAFALRIVLIDRPQRGGAGGSGRFPAWVAMGDAPGERWVHVAVHELGHALGLGDEYEDHPPAVRPSRIEPNISTTPDPAASPWRARITADPAIQPTAAHGFADTVPAGTVGTFEGARYERTGFYRSSHGCAMRTASHPGGFCPACQDVLARALQDLIAR